jgi:hypothetical protein
MNEEFGAEAALFPEKEYISGIFVAVRYSAIIIFRFNISHPAVRQMHAIRGPPSVDSGCTPLYRIKACIQSFPCLLAD